MLTNEGAQALSKLIAEPDIFPEAREQFTRTLLDYYRDLLYRAPDPIPTPRRMW